mgnify:CR=1 FL=1|jgi:hypothetical protein
MVDQTTFCRVVRVPEECEDSVVVAHCSDFRWDPLGEQVGLVRGSRAEKIGHELLDMNCKRVEAPDVRGYQAGDSC